MRRWFDRSEANFRLTVNVVADWARVSYQRLALLLEERRFDELGEQQRSLNSAFIENARAARALQAAERRFHALVARQWRVGRCFVAGAQRGAARGTSAPGAEVAIRLQPNERGWIAGEVELEPDELRGDDVRWFILEALGAIGTPEARSFLKNATLLDEDGRCRALAEDILSQGTEPARGAR